MAKYGSVHIIHRLCLGLHQQLGQPRDGLGHPASFIPAQILRHHRDLMVVLAVDIGDVVIVAVVDPIAPRRLLHGPRRCQPSWLKWWSTRCRRSLAGEQGDAGGVVPAYGRS